MVAGLKEGRELGVQKGYELGAFLAGVVSQLQADAERGDKASFCADGRVTIPLSAPPPPGVELGFYAGAVRSWRQLQAQQPSLVAERADRALAACEELLASYPMYDPRDERLHDLLEALRGKFKVAAAQLGALQAYFPREAAAAAGGGTDAPANGASSAPGTSGSRPSLAY